MNYLEQIVTSTNDFAEFAQGYFDRLREVLDTLEPEDLRALAATFEEARLEGRTIFVAGNGGSATTATSMANDLGFDILKKAGVSRTFRIMALTDNLAAITAIANDIGYDNVFVRQLEIHHRPGDPVVVISASGNSPNVVAAAEWVKERGGKVIAFLGFSGGRLKEMSDVILHVKTDAGEYGPVEDAHLVINHLLAHWFQAKLRGTE